MRLHSLILLTSLLTFFALGCGGGGGGGDDICDDVCGRADECGFLDGSESDCRSDCEDSLDDFDEVSGACEEAFVDIFDCVLDRSCDELEDLATGGLNPDVVEEIAEECRNEAEELIDACEELIEGDVDRAVVPARD